MNHSDKYAKKLILFGDSLLGRFGKELINQLETALDGEFDVYNCAAGGWDTNDAVHKATYIASLRPEVVIISLGINDAAPWKQVTLEQFKENVSRLLPYFKNSRIIFFLPPPVDEIKAPNEAKRLNRTIKQYHDAAKAVCTRHSVEVLDSWSIFFPLLKKNQDYYIEDDVHFNELGYQTLISEITKVVNRENHDRSIA